MTERNPRMRVSQRANANLPTMREIVSKAQTDADEICLFCTLPLNRGDSAERLAALEAFHSLLVGTAVPACEYSRGFGAHLAARRWVHLWMFARRRRMSMANAWEQCPPSEFDPEPYAWPGLAYQQKQKEIRRRYASRPGRSPIQKFNDQNEIVAYIRGFTDLRLSGQTMRGRCPIHGGSNASALAVYPEERRYHCFNCHKSGDAWDFHEDMVQAGRINSEPLSQAANTAVEEVALW